MSEERQALMSRKSNIADIILLKALASSETYYRYEQDKHLFKDTEFARCKSKY
jgi:hypothetical protein